MPRRAWVWMSMNPGAITRPWTSITRVAASPIDGAIFTIASMKRLRMARIVARAVRYHVPPRHDDPNRGATSVDDLPRGPRPHGDAARLVRADRQPARGFPRPLRGHQRGDLSHARHAAAGHRRADRLHAAAGAAGSALGRLRRPMAAEADARRERFDSRRSGAVALRDHFDVADLRRAVRPELRVE